jgi:hypothetical protein
MPAASAARRKLAAIVFAVTLTSGVSAEDVLVKLKDVHGNPVTAKILVKPRSAKEEPHGPFEKEKIVECPDRRAEIEVVEPVTSPLHNILSKDKIKYCVGPEVEFIFQMAGGSNYTGRKDRSVH